MSAPTLAPSPPPDAGPDRVVTPTVRRRLRRAAGWIAVAVLVLGALGIALASTSRPDAVPWGPDDPSPEGSKAYVQVLREQGVRVTATTSFAQTREAIRDPARTTIVLADAAGYLSGGKLRRLGGLAAHLVLLEPGFEDLRALAPGVAIRGAGSGVAGGCRFGGLERGDRVRATGTRYLPETGSSARTCLGDRTAGYGLVRVDGDPRVDVVGAADALRNGRATQRANAAFGLALLGDSRDVVWYVPGTADLPTGAASLPSALVPPWWPPVAALLAAVFVAAVIWRGRRFGPLAVENLPVVVPASETMEGRARLYARSSSRLHALDALRIGAVGRLASACGLPPGASVDETVDAVAAAVGRPRGEIAGILRDVEPADDATLMTMSGALAELERQTRDATRAR